MRKYSNKSNIKIFYDVNDIKKLIYKSNCVVLPTKYNEGLPRSLLEAASIGRPIITTNVPGCQRIAKRNFNALIYDKKKPKDLSRCIIKFILMKKNKKIDMSLNSNEVAKKFNEKKIILKYIKLVDEKKVKIGIIGLGYVGLPLFLEFSKKFNVKGFDLSKEKVKKLYQKKDFTNQFSKKDLKKISQKNVSYNSVILKNCNFFIVTVPTPLNSKKLPDLSAVISATKTVSKYIKDRGYVVYESTVYPGVTEDICIKIIEKQTGLKPFNDLNNKLKKGFYYGYSPERINPGDAKHNLKRIIKITSGGTKSSAKFIDNLYKKICLAGTYKAKSVRVAEGAKVIENTQRDINIALVNEFSQIFSKMNINTYDVLQAAKTKWNF